MTRRVLGLRITADGMAFDHATVVGLYGAVQECGWKGGRARTMKDTAPFCSPFGSHSICLAMRGDLDSQNDRYQAG